MLWSQKTYIALRVLDKTGHYPSFGIRTQAHAYCASEEVIWAAAVQRPLPSDWELGEITVLAPEEVRLLSAVTLSEPDPWTNGTPIVTGLLTENLDPEEIGFDVRAPSTYEALTRRAIALRDTVPDISPKGYADNAISQHIGDLDDALELLSRIDVEDQLLLAGLARLLAANRLMSLHESEEAAIILFVSMGAAFEFLRQHLATELGKTDVPFSKVDDYFRATFPDGDGVAENFACYYEQRVMATHPSSRFGEYWAPPIMASDLYHLRKSLMALYRHILLGEIT